MILISTANWSVIIGIALTVALTFGTYLAHRIPNRSRGAKERCRIVYEKFLIKKVNEVIKGVEKGDSLYFHLGEFEEEIKSLSLESLKSTKNCLDRLNKVSKDYTDMHDIATGRIREKLEKLLRDSYKNISEGEQEKILSYLGKSGDAVNGLCKYFSALEYYLVRVKVKDENINFGWFKRLQLYDSYDWKEKLNEMLRDARKSLESFFQDLDSWLNNEASIRFLKDYQRVCLNEAKNAKEKLEKDAKKLKSKWGFVYGIGDEQMLQDLKEKIKIQEKGSEVTFRP